MDWIKKSNEKRGVTVWLLFLAAAAIAMAVILLPFLVRGNHLIWAAWEKDGATQHVTYLNHMREVGWLKAIGDYDFYIGLGADYLTSLSFMSLFDPFVVFVYVLPIDIVWVYDCIIFLKYICAGAAFFWYMRYRGVAGGYAIVLSLCYMCSGFVFFTFARHLNLTSGAIYLPIMAMGLERIYRKKNPFVLFVSAFLCLTNSFYMFFFNSVFIVLYAFFYHAEACAESGTKYWKTLVPRCWKIALVYLLAIALAGFMLLPNAYGYLNAARSASKGMAEITLGYLTCDFYTFLFPVVTEHYSTVGINLFAFLLLLAACFSRGKKGRAMRIATIVFTIGFFSLVFGFFMNFFNYANNRWSYILIFCALALIGLNSGDTAYEESYPAEVRRKVVKAFCVFFGAALIVTCMWAMEVLFSGTYLLVFKILLAILLAFTIAGLVVFLIWLFSRHSPFAVKEQGGRIAEPAILSGKIADKIARPCVLYRAAAICAVVFCFAYYCFYSAEHIGAQVYRSLTSPEQEYVSQLNETEYFRTDSACAESWWDCFRNLGVNGSYYSTRSYNSMSSSKVYKFLKENAVYNPTQNLGISGLDNRPALQSLLSVRYYIGSEGETVYGMNKVQGEGLQTLYENTNYIPFGFAYQNTLSRQYYESLDPVLRQYAMLSAMIVEEGASLQETDAGQLETLDTEFSAKSAKDFSVVRGEEITLTVRGCKGKEIYLRFTGASVPENRTEIKVSGNGKTRTYMYAPKGDLMYSEQRDPCFYLGVGQEDTVTITLSLVRGQELSFDSVAVQGYAVSQYEERVAALKNAPHLEGVKIGENSVTGEISLDFDGYIFLSLPYDAGWSAQIDGEDADIIAANSGFMAVKAEKGTHALRLTYHTPYLKEGCLLTAAAAGASVLILGIWQGAAFMQRRKKREESEEDSL